MKKFWMLLAASAVVGTAVWVAVRVAETPSNAAVSSLLPHSTIALVHLPDFNATVDQWHHSDIYQIYKEPAVQEFLQKPASRVTKTQTASKTISEIKELNPKDIFLALTSLENDRPKIVVGFRFRSSEETANRIIGIWRDKIRGDARQETVSYQRHDIQVIHGAAFPLATVEDHDWFFASNDIEELKQVLDRADGRIKNRKTLLRTDPAFDEAIHAMPSSYAVLLYLQPKTFSERIAAVRSALAPSTLQNQRTIIEEMRSFCASTRFDDGKMHDVIFLGMPQQEENIKLTRSSLSMGTSATFFYLASLINFSKQAAVFSPAGGTSFLGAGVEKVARALAAAGVRPEDWKRAFGSEVGVLADWPKETRWPALIVTAPVKDKARAAKIAEALTHGIDEDAVWDQTEQNGVSYWSMQTVPTVLPIRPEIGLSNHVLVIGLDESSVQGAIQRSQKDASELASSDTYKRAAHLVPPPTNFFSYTDLALLYSRLDATLRPILIMAAAFMPAISNSVDLNKIPPPEVITKHLSPIICSQRYTGKGYMVESIGPITFNQAGIGVALLVGLGAFGYEKSGAAWNGLGFPSPSAPAATASPSPTPGKPQPPRSGRALPSPRGTP
jgi:hypothetical protein